MFSKSKTWLPGIFLIGLVTFILSCKKNSDVPLVPQEAGGSEIATGLKSLAPREYEKIPLIEEPLMNARTLEKLILPESYVIPNLPPIGDQKNMNSCVGWATGYAARTMMYVNSGVGSAVYTDGSGNLRTDLVFSPEYIWTSINGGINQPTYIYKALELIQNEGVAKWKDFSTAYKPSPPPTVAQRQMASSYKVKSWGRINISEASFKRFLYYDVPILVAITADNNLMKPTQILEDGSVVWNKISQVTLKHAVAIVGYSKERNAFLIQNSWGRNWAGTLTPEQAKGPRSGYCWMDYGLLSTAVSEAYVMIANEWSSEPPVVTTERATEISVKQVTLNGGITNFKDTPVTEYGFLVSADSLSMMMGSRAENFSTKAPLASPYTFSKTYKPDGIGKKFYRAYAKSLTDIYYGKILSVNISPEPEDSGEIAGSVTVRTLFDDHMTKSGGYELYSYDRNFLFDFHFSGKHEKYIYKACYLLTSDGKYYTAFGISDEGKGVLDLSSSYWTLRLPDGRYSEGYNWPDVGLYSMDYLFNFSITPSRSKNLGSETFGQFVLVFSDSQDFDGAIIKTPMISFPQLLNSENFKPTKGKSDSFEVHF
jgi:hypothetical protein